MGILSKEIEINLCSKNIKHYEDLGYEIPRVKKKNSSKMVVKRGTKIFVKFEDMTQYSNIDLDAECDCCKKEYKISKLL